MFHLFAIAYSASHPWLPDVHDFIVYMCATPLDIDTDRMRFLAAYSQAAFRAIFAEPIKLVQNISRKSTTQPRAMPKRMKERMLLDLVASQYNDIFGKFFAEAGKPEQFIPFIVPPVIPAHRTLQIYQLYGFPEDKQETLMEKANKDQVPTWVVEQFNEHVNSTISALPAFCYEKIVVRERAFPRLVGPSAPDKQYLNILVNAAATSPSTPRADPLALAIQEAGLEAYLGTTPVATQADARHDSGIDDSGVVELDKAAVAEAADHNCGGHERRDYANISRKRHVTDASGLESSTKKQKDPHQFFFSRNC